MAAVVAAAAAAMVFAYAVLLRLPPGVARLVATIPCLVVLWRLAWDVPTVHLRSLVAFFFTWMITFKLLLLCFDLGPASDPLVTKSFPRFFASMALSFNIPRKRSTPWAQEDSAEPWPSVILRALFKLCLVALLFKIVYKERYNPKMPVVILYLTFSLHIYLAASLIFESLAAIASATIGLALEPPFNAPFLASSLADFWGRRWNILTSSVLRATIYEPILRCMLKDDDRGVPMLPRALATMAVFLVSGLMHELIFLYMNKSAPTWQVTAFFLVNGIASVLESGSRRFNRGRLKIPRLLATMLTLSFVFATACWLFFPPIHQTGTCFQALDEFEGILLTMNPNQFAQGRNEA